MQPTLTLSASHPGILYLNGSFAGEIAADQPLLRPVGARGAVYLDYRPFADRCLPMARRLVFSGGTPMAQSLEEAEGLSAVLWPGAVTEIEFTPQTLAPPQSFLLAGHSFLLEPDGPKLSCDGRFISALPPGAQVPESLSISGSTILLGRCDGGNYLLTLDMRLCKPTGFLRAQQLDVEPDGRIRAVVNHSDLVGHATLENWRLTPEGLIPISSEPAWANGAPRWPQTPAETARAAVEAVLAGLDAEAERYLSPALKNRFSPTVFREKCDLCVEMKYSPPNGRLCVGLLRLEGDRLGRVTPLYFRSGASGGPQGPYWIEDFSFE